MFKLKFFSNTLLCLLLLSSCQDNQIGEEAATPASPHGLSFSPSVAGAWQMQATSPEANPLHELHHALPADTVLELPGSSSDSLYLYVEYSYTEDSIPNAANITTRGTPASTELLSETYSSFRFSAYRYKKTETRSSASSDLTPLLHSVRANKPGAGSTYWPAESGFSRTGTDDGTRFFAWMSDDNSMATYSDTDRKGLPSLTYSIPPDGRVTKDLLAACGEGKSGTGTVNVPLQFQHLLTRLHFKYADLAGLCVKKITLEHIDSKGTFIWNGRSTGDIGQWTSQTNKQTFTLDCSANNANQTMPSPGNQPEYTCLMLPQTFSSDSARVIVVLGCNDGTGDTEVTLTAKLKGLTWKAGQTVSFTISASKAEHEYVLEAQKSKDWGESDFNPLGDQKKLYVRSFKKRKGGSREIPVTWHLEYLSGNNRWTPVPKEQWIGGQGTRSNRDVLFKTVSGSDKDTIPFELSGLPISQVIDDDTYALRNEKSILVNCGNSLRNAANLASGHANNTNDFIISNKQPLRDGGTGRWHERSRISANCYMIHQGGWYCLPLVYGNSILNKSFYVNSNNHPNFVDANGKVFENIKRNPEKIKIKYTGYTDEIPAANVQVEILWQDFNKHDVISQVQIAKTNSHQGGIGLTDLKYMAFYINPRTIRPGNAVVCIKENGRILWSWHLWFTVRPDVHTVYTKNGRAVSLMDRPLGYVPSKVYEYSPRSFQARIVQKEGKKTVNIAVLQPGGQTAFAGSNTFYQWGRKDPFAGGNPKDPEHSSTVWGRKTSVGYLGSGMELLRKAIENPTVMTTDMSSLARDPRYANLWNYSCTQGLDYGQQQGGAIMTNDRETKTLYDPCPPGWRVALTNSFSGYIQDGNGSNHSANLPQDKKKVKIVGEFEHGWNLGSALHYMKYPSTGKRSGTQIVQTEGTNDEAGMYWMADPISVNGWNQFPYMSVQKNGISTWTFEDKNANALSIVPAVGK